MIRKPAVAGQFYYADAARLSKMVEDLIPEKVDPREGAIAVMCPHAGLVYSGAVAGAVYAAIKPPHTYILLGPNHTGLGSAVALMPKGTWEIPTGMFAIDEKLAGAILKSIPDVSDDAQAHLFEHSLEVQLPFIARFSKSAEIVPITIMSGSVEEFVSIGEGIAKVVSETDYPVIIVASSDMSHYVSDEEARRKDRLAIDKILELDPEGLCRVVKEERISMCGYMPATVMLAAARALGATGARLVKYATSGEVSGDFDQVVGYAGIVIR